MSVPLVINGVTYNYPQQFDTNWGPTLTAWSTAVTNGMLQKAGGSFPLTAEVNFGTSFGIKALYLKGTEANIAHSGNVRLANASVGIAWRNALNNGDLPLTVDSSNNLIFNNVVVGSSNTLTDGHIFVGNILNAPADVAMSGDVHIDNTGATTIQSGVVTGSKIAANTIADGNMISGTLTDASINASAAIALSKLAGLTANKALQSNAFGIIAPSSVTATELGFVAGASSNIQAQINAITGAGSFTSGMLMIFAGSAAPAGWLICDGSAVSRTTYSSLFGVIGTTYGVGDGSTTFNIPDLVDNVPVGSGGTIVNTLGSTAGTTTVTPTAQPHDHTISHKHYSPVLAVNGQVVTGNGLTDWPDGTTNVTCSDVNAGAGSGVSASRPALNTGDSLTANSGSTTVTMNASSVVQPSLGINYIIKT